VKGGSCSDWESLLLTEEAEEVYSAPEAAVKHAGAKAGGQSTG
jgi:hypothetical protein